MLPYHGRVDQHEFEAAEFKTLCLYDSSLKYRKRKQRKKSIRSKSIKFGCTLNQQKTS